MPPYTVKEILSMLQKGILSKSNLNKILQVGGGLCPACNEATVDLEAHFKEKENDPDHIIMSVMEL